MVTEVLGSHTCQAVVLLSSSSLKLRIITIMRRVVRQRPMTENQRWWPMVVESFIIHEIYSLSIFHFPSFSSYVIIWGAVKIPFFRVVGIWRKTLITVVWPAVLWMDSSARFSIHSVSHAPCVFLLITVRSSWLFTFCSAAAVPIFTLIHARKR